MSPYAKRDHVSHRVYDHTSILAMLEHKWNLPAMTYRDANAHPMTDYFDLRRPAFARPPRLAAPPGLAPGLDRCAAEGFSPPLPSSSPGSTEVGGPEVGRLLAAHFRR